MQTFLPYPDFTLSAQALDNKRLGKQRVEAMQILQTLQNGSKWENHPAVLMWKRFEPNLKDYLLACVIEWQLRGFTNTIDVTKLNIKGPSWYPEWFTHPAFHLSHRIRLYQKDPVEYEDMVVSDVLTFKSKIDMSIPYLWPVCKEHQRYRENTFYVLGQGKKDAKLWGPLSEILKIKIIVP